jgi:hypothetical protein
VTAVIEEHPALPAGLGVGRDLVAELADPGAQLVGRRVDDDVDLIGLVAAELGEQGADAPRVVLGVLEVGLAGPALVRANDDRVGRDRVVGESRRGACERQDGKSAESSHVRYLGHASFSGWEP